MKYDSYPRFLKSDVLKIGKEIPVMKIHDEKSIGKLKDEEKKDKKRSPFLPWTKGKFEYFFDFSRKVFFI